MPVLIVQGLKSTPEAIKPGESATLQLGLQSQTPAGEETTVEYRLSPGNDVVFAENGNKFITETFTVASAPTPASRAYALTSVGGKVVTITAIVLPERLEKSKEAVTILK
jgi:hypothetical protein